MNQQEFERRQRIVWRVVYAAFGLGLVAAVAMLVAGLAGLNKLAGQ